MHKKAVKKNEGKSVPGKLTAEVLSTIINQHTDGLSLAVACELQYVTVSSFFTYCDKHPEFKEQVFKPARERYVDSLEEKAFTMATASDARYPTMLIFMLKAHRRSVYGERLNATLTPGGDFTGAFFTAMEKARDASQSTQH